MEKINTLTIRADATIDIGTGHVMRCIALGQQVIKSGGTVNFISNCDNETIISRLLNENFLFFKIDSDRSNKAGLKQTLQILSDLHSGVRQHQRNKKGWVILDGYHFGYDFQNAIQNADFRLMVVDDYNHLPCYAADIILNQNIAADRYTYTTNTGTLKLLGLEYAMIRDEFILGEKAAANSGKTLRILVTLGGSDPSNATLKIVKALKKLKHKNKIKVKILLGPSNPYFPTIESIINGTDKIMIIQNGDMPSLLNWAELAVTAAGSTCLELCYFGIPFITLIAAKNQEVIAKNFHEAGISINLGWATEMAEKELIQAVESHLEGRWRKGKKCQLPGKLVDGMGTKRILNKMAGIYE